MSEEIIAPEPSLVVDEPKPKAEPTPEEIKKSYRNGQKLMKKLLKYGKRENKPLEPYAKQMEAIGNVQDLIHKSKTVPLTRRERKKLHRSLRITGVGGKK